MVLLSDPPKVHVYERGTHRAAGWPDLFGDLVFVAIIAELTHLLIEGFTKAESNDQDTTHHEVSDNAHRSRELVRHLSSSAEIRIIFSMSRKATSLVASFLFGNMAWNTWLLDCVCTSRFKGGKDITGRFLHYAHMATLVFFAGNVSLGFNPDTFANICWAYCLTTLIVLVRYSRGFRSDPIVAKPLIMAVVPLGLLTILTHLAAAVVASQTGDSETSSLSQDKLLLGHWRFGSG